MKLDWYLSLEFRSSDRRRMGLGRLSYKHHTPTG